MGDLLDKLRDEARREAAARREVSRGQESAAPEFDLAGSAESAAADEAKVVSDAVTSATRRVPGKQPEQADLKRDLARKLRHRNPVVRPGSRETSYVPASDPGMPSLSNPTLTGVLPIYFDPPEDMPARVRDAEWAKVREESERTGRPAVRVDKEPLSLSTEAAIKAPAFARGVGKGASLGLTNLAGDSAMLGMELSGFLPEGYVESMRQNEEDNPVTSGVGAFAGAGLAGALVAPGTAGAAIFNPEMRTAAEGFKYGARAGLGASAGEAASDAGERAMLDVPQLSLSDQALRLSVGAGLGAAVGLPAGALGSFAKGLRRKIPELETAEAGGARTALFRGERGLVAPPEVDAALARANRAEAHGRSAVDLITDEAAGRALPQAAAERDIVNARAVSDLDQARTAALDERYGTTKPGPPGIDRGELGKQRLTALSDSAQALEIQEGLAAAEREHSARLAKGLERDEVNQYVQSGEDYGPVVKRQRAREALSGVGDVAADLDARRLEQLKAVYPRLEQLLSDVERAGGDPEVALRIAASEGVTPIRDWLESVHGRTLKTAAERLADLDPSGAESTAGVVARAHELLEKGKTTAGMDTRMAREVIEKNTEIVPYHLADEEDVRYLEMNPETGEIWYRVPMLKEPSDYESQRRIIASRAGETYAPEKATVSALTDAMIASRSPELSAAQAENAADLERMKGTLETFGVDPKSRAVGSDVGTLEGIEGAVSRVARTPGSLRHKEAIARAAENPEASGALRRAIELRQLGEEQLQGGMVPIVGQRPAIQELNPGQDAALRERLQNEILGYPELDATNPARRATLDSVMGARGRARLSGQEALHQETEQTLQFVKRLQGMEPSYAQDVAQLAGLKPGAASEGVDADNVAKLMVSWTRGGLGAQERRVLDQFFGRAGISKEMVTARTAAAAGVVRGRTEGAMRLRGNPLTNIAVHLARALRLRLDALSRPAQAAIRKTAAAPGVVADPASHAAGDKARDYFREGQE